MASLRPNSSMQIRGQLWLARLPQPLSSTAATLSTALSSLPSPATPASSSSSSSCSSARRFAATAATSASSARSFSSGTTLISCSSSSFRSALSSPRSSSPSAPSQRSWAIGLGPGSRRHFAYEDTFAYRIHGPKPLCMMINPVLQLNGRTEKPWDQHLLDSEEALSLVRSLRWDVLPGPHEPKHGWDEEALERAEEAELQRRYEAGAFDIVPEGWHKDRGEAESDDEFDVNEVAWNTPSIRQQYAETCCVKLRRIDPFAYFGKGKVAELAIFVAKQPCDYVFINTVLTPTQIKNLEIVFNNSVIAADAEQRRQQEREAYNSKYIPSVEVVDRNRVILELFSLRAKTPMAKLQAKIAKVEYMKSRLTQGCQARIREFIQVLQEEIGPFRETTKRHTGVEVQYHYEQEPFQTERKLLRSMEKRLKIQLAKERRSREVQRLNRAGVPTIGIVGYTNVGKTALMNALTGSDLKEKNIMFQTLEPTMRRLKLPSGRHAILSDSLGFIQNFPTMMTACFKSTVEDVVGCDILLHVRDVSHPQATMHKHVVLKALQEAGVPQEKIDASVIEVWNKVDQLGTMDYVPPEAIPVSATENIGLYDLIDVIDVVVSAQVGQRRRIMFPESKMKTALDFLRKYGIESADESLQMVEDHFDHNGEAMMSVDAVLPDHLWRRWSVEVQGLPPEAGRLGLPKPTGASPVSFALPGESREGDRPRSGVPLKELQKFMQAPRLTDGRAN